MKASLILKITWKKVTKVALIFNYSVIPALSSSKNQSICLSVFKLFSLLASSSPENHQLEKTVQKILSLSNKTHVVSQLKCLSLRLSLILQEIILRTHV